MSALRDVLTAFEQSSGPISLQRLAQQLDISPPVLEDMIHFWVRKGKVRETGDAETCNTCGSVRGCPFVMNLPRRFELVRDGETTAPHCHHLLNQG
ncbi:MAG: FeoC-like transcriptional regulator [Chloroflexi bacterium]|nr:FeoC-like transcriptional regulator [Chloroflexota bacterium]